MINCPRCGFEQPRDQFCAKCGIDMHRYTVKKPPFSKRYGIPVFGSILLFVFLIGFRAYYFLQSPTLTTLKKGLAQKPALDLPQRG